MFYVAVWYVIETGVVGHKETPHAYVHTVLSFKWTSCRLRAGNLCNSNDQAVPWLLVMMFWSACLYTQLTCPVFYNLVVVWLL